MMAQDSGVAARGGTLDLFQEFLERQVRLEQRVEHLEFNLKIRKRRSQKPHPYEDWMPDFIAAFRESKAHVIPALEACVARGIEVPSSQTLYRRRDDCRQLRAEWLEVLEEAADTAQAELDEVEASLDPEGTTLPDRLAQQQAREIKTRVSILRRSREDMLKEDAERKARK